MSELTSLSEASGSAPVRAPGREAAGRVLYVQYTNPGVYPPLEHSAHILAEHGWKVGFLGVALSEGRQLQLAPHQRISVERLPHHAGRFRRRLRYFQYCAWVARTALRWRPHWLYASDALAALPALLARRCGASVLYHEHDAPDGRAGGSAFARLMLRARAALVARAELCVLPGDERAQPFLATFPHRRPAIVWNCPLRDEVAAARTPLPTGTLRVLYHGSIVPARLPLSVIHALARLPGGVRLTIAGYPTLGFPDYVERLLGEAHALGIGDRVAYVGSPALRSDLLACAGACDLGLALMPRASADHNERTMFSGPSNKVFDYLARGLALLISDTPAWRELYVAPGYGLACDAEDPASIAAALAWCLDHPDELRTMGERGRQRVLDAWNYEAQFAPVLAQMQAAL